MAAVDASQRRTGVVGRSPIPRPSAVLAWGSRAGYATCMFIAALLVGVLVAYYFGLRPGLFAAAATAGLFLAAAVMPVVAIYAYVLVGAGVAGVVLLGPKLKRPDALASGAGGLSGRALHALASVRRAVKQVSARVNGEGGGARRGKGKAARR
jgi:hypothetical protein